MGVSCLSKHFRERKNRELILLIFIYNFLHRIIPSSVTSDRDGTTIVSNSIWTTSLNSPWAIAFFSIFGNQTPISWMAKIPKRTTSPFPTHLFGSETTGICICLEGESNIRCPEANPANRISGVSLSSLGNKEAWQRSGIEQSCCAPGNETCRHCLPYARRTGVHFFSGNNRLKCN